VHVGSLNVRGDERIVDDNSLDVEGLRVGFLVEVQHLLGEERDELAGVALAEHEEVVRLQVGEGRQELLHEIYEVVGAFFHIF